MDLILEESAEISAAPFLELLKEAPGRDPNHWAQQGIALRVLERLVSDEECRPIMEALRDHPAPALRAWIRGRMETTDRPVRVTSNGGVELVLIPAGRFRMGSSEGEGYGDERPAHGVDVRPFYLGRYPVTNEGYARFMEVNPDVEEPAFWSDRKFNQARQPVVGVSWDEARRFAEWAGGRLPSEAEWEYAARAGTTTEYWWGDDIGSSRANGAGTGSPWSGKQTSPVGSFEPNPFGLYDTAGNVWEWVEDLWHDGYRGAPGDGSAWEDGGPGGRRVVRGGSWNFEPGFLRSADRSGLAPDFRNFALGFRLAQDL